MSHLGEYAAALVDNELGHDARDRALAHLASCAQCRAEVDRQRRLRSLLANQADPEVSGGLTARLLAIPAEQQTPIGLDSSRQGRRWPALGAVAFVPTATRPAGTRRPRLAGPTGRPRHSRRRRTVRRALAGSAAAIALTAGLATAGGPTASAGPATTPPVDRFIQQHTVMTARLPFADTGAVVVESVVLGR